MIDSWQGTYVKLRGAQGSRSDSLHLLRNNLKGDLD